MPDEGSTEVAESSPALEIPRSATPEYAEWRVSGKLPEPKAASTPAEEKVDTGEATAPTKQELPARPKTKTAEQRIAELEATIEKISKGAGIERRKAESSPASETKPATQTRPKPTPEGKGPDGKPYAAYEDYIEDLSDWKVEQRMAAEDQKRATREQQATLKAELDKARTRYNNLDEVMFPALKTITDANVNPVVMTMLNESEVLPDVLYTIGSSEDDLATFVKMAKQQPGKAIRYLAITENLIREELDKNVPRGTPEKGADGKFISSKPDTPAKRGPESSPEPPIEISARGGRVMDESERVLSAAERGDPKATRAWFAAENAKDLRRRRGA